MNLLRVQKHIFLDSFFVLRLNHGTVERYSKGSKGYRKFDHFWVLSYVLLTDTVSAHSALRMILLMIRSWRSPPTPHATLYLVVPHTLKVNPHPKSCPSPPGTLWRSPQTSPCPFRCLSHAESASELLVRRSWSPFDADTATYNLYNLSGSQFDATTATYNAMYQPLDILSWEQHPFDQTRPYVTMRPNWFSCVSDIGVLSYLQCKKWRDLTKSRVHLRYQQHSSVMLPCRSPG